MSLRKKTSMQEPPRNAGPKGLAADRRRSARRQLGDAGQRRARQIIPTGMPQQRTCVSSPVRPRSRHPPIRSIRGCRHSHARGGPHHPERVTRTRPDALDAASATPTMRSVPSAVAGCCCPSDWALRAVATTPPRCSISPACDRAELRHRAIAMREEQRLAEVCGWAERGGRQLSGHARVFGSGSLLATLLAGFVRDRAITQPHGATSALEP
jgi:hypothetical protein